MAYSVELTVRAERDLAALYLAIDAENSQTAARWYRRMKQAILSLEELPARCPVTAESPRLRHLLFGRKPHVYRIIFRVVEREKRVQVIHVRHGAQRNFKKSG